ncbi:MAG: serine/threonine protein kinase [Promethearchaeota archaeon]
MSSSSKEFLQCPQCKTIYLLDNKETHSCEKCQYPKLEKISGRFILRCKKCGLTQNKNSFMQLHGNTALSCQASNCNGDLKAIQIGINPNAPSTATNKSGAIPGFGAVKPPKMPKRRKLAAQSSHEAEKLVKTLAAQPKPKIKKSSFFPFPIIEESTDAMENGKSGIRPNQPPADLFLQNLQPFPTSTPAKEEKYKQKDHAGIRVGDVLMLNDIPYQVILKIGTGGMGAVHKVKNLKTGEFSALKEFYYTRFHDPESGKNFCEKYWERESHITAIQSESPERSMKFIGKLHLTQFHNPEYYIFLEYIEGTPLDKWYLEKFPDLSHLTLPVLQDLIKNILMPITRHMYFCHQKGIVHRDLTVQNIMIVSPDENTYYPIIIDWGVAKEIGLEKIYNPRKPYYVSATPEATGIRNRGTPPEVMAGFEPIATTDVYMLGHIMFYLFSGGNYAGAAATNEDFVLHPGDFNPKLPEEFNKLVEYMTQYEPADRMADMVKVYDALQWIYEAADKIIQKSKSPQSWAKYYLYCDYNQGFLEIPPRQIVNIGRDEILHVGRTHEMDGHIYNALLPTDDGKFSFQLYIDNDIAYIRDIYSPMGTFLSKLTMPNQQVYNNVAIKNLDNVAIQLSSANLGNMLIEVPFVAPDGKTYRIPFKIYKQEVE